MQLTKYIKETGCRVHMPIYLHKYDKYVFFTS